MAASNHLVINRIFMLVLLCYPPLLLTVRGSMNALFFLMVITSFIYLFRTRKSQEIRLWDGYSKAFAIAMASPVLAVLLSQAYHGTFTAPPLDGPSRFLFAIPIFLALRQTEIRTVTFLQYGLPLGALVALLSTIITEYKWEDNFYFVNYSRYSFMSLILGLLALYSINWTTQDRAPALILKICGFLAGVFLSIQSGARGGWIAIPVLLFIWWLSRNPKISWPKLAAIILSILLTVALSYVFIEKVHSRIDMIYQDLSDFQHGNKDTSLGARLQLWQVAGKLITENPVFGVGPDGFAQMMSSLNERGVITTWAASLGRGEVHNEILAKTVGLGLFGLLSSLAVFVVPLIIFIRFAHSAVAQKRTAAYVGICLVTGFFIFGLSLEIFNLKMIDAFYSLTVAVLIAAATHKTPGQDL
jgi:O-antigen ligase